MYGKWCKSGTVFKMPIKVRATPENVLEWVKNAIDRIKGREISEKWDWIGWVKMWRLFELQVVSGVLTLNKKRCGKNRQWKRQRKRDEDWGLCVAFSRKWWRDAEILNKREKSPKYNSLNAQILEGTTLLMKLFGISFVWHFYILCCLSWHSNDFSLL